MANHPQVNLSTILTTAVGTALAGNFMLLGNLKDAVTETKVKVDLLSVQISKLQDANEKQDAQIRDLERGKK